MKFAHLFSGIGGFALASDWMGWETVLNCEIDPFCQRILKYYWPKAELYGDIKTTDFSIHRGRIDILTGGFPCQPYSTAGKRLGKEDERHLWPEMLRAIREIQPSYVVGENVRGLTNWNGGVVFDEVQSDLEAAGYEVIPFLLPSASVNAPHRRDRIWFIAYAESIRRSFRITPDLRAAARKKHALSNTDKIYAQQLTADAEAPGFQIRNAEYQQEISGPTRRHGQTNWQNFPTQPPVRGGDDGLPSELDGITFSKWRRESIKGYGNAIVPQVALQIYKAIAAYLN